jgi:hypothetical protein
MTLACRQDSFLSGIRFKLGMVDRLIFNGLADTVHHLRCQTRYCGHVRVIALILQRKDARS